MAHDTDIMQAALSYAERGWPVLPCDPRSKTPVTDNGLYDATIDAAQIRAWWMQWPGAMVAVRTGQVSGVWGIDLDIDREKQIDGRATFANLAEGKDPVPDTMTNRTPRGGEHLIFKWTGPVKNRAGIAHGVDVRGDGGYLIMPPSVRGDGRSYEEIVAVWPPAEAPQWLAELAADKRQDKRQDKPEERATEARGNGHDRSYGEAALKAECDRLAAAELGTRNDALNTAAFNLGQLIGGNVLSESEVRRRLEQAAYSCGLIRDDGKDAVQATLESGLSAGMTHPRSAPEGERATAELNGEDDRRESPLRWIDMSEWDGEPRPAREWAILNRVPLRQAGLFSGEGGAGKSIIEMMKDVAHVAGKDWLGSLPEPGPAFYIGAEGDEKEIHIRFYDIAAHYGVTFKELVDGGLRVLCLLGQDATLCAAGKSGKVETTALYRQIYEAAGDIKPKNISIDTLSRAFAGNEIDRVQVYAFAMYMQALAKVANGSTTVLSHPSLAGIASGSGISGSTAWHGAFRFRQYLKGVKSENGEPVDSDLRELEFKKNQYGPIGEKIVLRYQRGLFLPEKGMSTLEKAAAEAKTDQEFQNNVVRFNSQMRNVSAKQNAPTYAPAEFAKEPEAKKAGLRKTDFEAAMRRLLAAGKIRIEPYGPPSRGWTRLVIA